MTIMTPELDKMIEEGFRKDKNIPEDWTYEDINWTDFEKFETFRNNICKEDVAWIVITHYPGKGVRAQAMWSPKGLQLKRTTFDTQGTA